MFYEEKVVDGVLCCRGTPNGMWTPLSAYSLTGKILDLQRQLNDYRLRQG